MSNRNGRPLGARAYGSRTDWPVTATLPIELVEWLDEVCDERDCHRRVLVRVAVERLRSEIEAHGDVGGLPSRP